MTDLEPLIREILWLPYAAFLLMPVLTGLMWWLHWLSGKKTTSLITFIVGMELVDFSWMPDSISDPLLTGAAIAALMANTFMSARHKEKPS